VVDLKGGIYAPEGGIGVSYTRALVGPLALSVGGGYGTTGLQASTPLRVQDCRPGLCVGVGLGPSMSSTFNLGDELRLFEYTRYEGGPTVWGNAEVFLVKQWRRGFRLGVGLGLTNVLYASNVRRFDHADWDGNSDNGMEEQEVPVGNLNFTKPYLWVSVGGGSEHG